MVADFLLWLTLNMGWHSGADALDPPGSPEAERINRLLGTSPSGGWIDQLPHRSLLKAIASVMVQEALRQRDARRVRWPTYLTRESEELIRTKSELIRRRDELVAEVEAAFADVSGEGGMSIEDAEAELISQTESVARRGDRTLTPWQDVDVHAIDPGGTALNFMDPIAYRYYLPAYLRFALLHGFNILGDFVDSNAHAFLPDLLTLSDRGDRPQREQWSRLDPLQRRAVAQFLVFHAEMESLQSPDADRGSPPEGVAALASHWLADLPIEEQRAVRRRWGRWIDPERNK